MLQDFLQTQDVCTIVEFESKLYDNVQNLMFISLSILLLLKD